MPSINPSQSPSFKPQEIPSFKPSNKIDESASPTSQPSKNLRSEVPSRIDSIFESAKPTILGTAATTSLATFNSSFNQSLPQPPQNKASNISFIQKPEGIAVTVIGAAVLLGLGLKWIYSRGKPKIEPSSILDPQESYQVSNREVRIINR